MEQFGIHPAWTTLGIRRTLKTINVCNLDTEEKEKNS